MKRLILILMTLVSVACYSQSIAEKAKEDYDKGDFGTMITLLEAELKIQKEGGHESPDLYYNLGNAYYRTGELAKARLNYERALLIDPSDRDIQHNIEFLSTKIEDKILTADTFFVSTWMRAIQSLFGSNAWATIGIVTFILFITCLFIFFFSKKVTVKQAVFYAGIVFIVVCTAGNVFARNQKRNIEERNTAVVMVGSATVHSAPDRNSKDVFTLHAGTKIDVLKEDRSWLEIEIADGSVGWIQREKIEII